MSKNSWLTCCGIFLIGAFGLLSCEPRYFRSNYHDANKLLYETKNPRGKPFLKAHLKNGDVCILKNSWQVDTAKDLVSGKGSTFDFNRRKIFDGDLLIPIDSVALFETNKKIVDPE